MYVCVNHDTEKLREEGREGERERELQGEKERGKWGKMRTIWKEQKQAELKGGERKKK